MIFFIYGPDEYRGLQKLNGIKQKYINEVDSSSSGLVYLDGENLDLTRISEASGAGSLFSRKRMIIISDVFLNKSQEFFKELRDYLVKLEKEDKKDGNIFIFHEKQILAGTKKSLLWKYLIGGRYVQEFPLLSATQASKWVQETAKSKNASMSVNSAMKLTAMFGSDLRRLDNEIKKLVNYKNAKISKLADSTGIVIGEEDIEEMCRGSVDEKIFAFSDAVASKNKALAMRLLENEIEAGSAETYLLHMLVRQFRILIQVRDALDAGLTQRKIALDLKLHPYVVQKSIKQAGNFPMPVLKNIFSGLIKLDKDMKASKADFKISIDLLFAKM